MPVDLLDRIKIDRLFIVRFGKVFEAVMLFLLLRTALIDLIIKDFAYLESVCFNPRRLVSVIAQMRLGRTCVL